MISARVSGSVEELDDSLLEPEFDGGVAAACQVGA